MECTKCHFPIELGQRYRRTKRGPYHRYCKNPNRGRKLTKAEIKACKDLAVRDKKDKFSLTLVSPDVVIALCNMAQESYHE